MKEGNLIKRIVDARNSAVSRRGRPRKSCPNRIEDIGNRKGENLDEIQKNINESEDVEEI